MARKTSKHITKGHPYNNRDEWTKKLMKDIGKKQKQKMSSSGNISGNKQQYYNHLH